MPSNVTTPHSSCRTALSQGGPYSYSYTLDRVYPDDGGISDWQYEYSTESIGAIA